MDAPYAKSSTWASTYLLAHYPNPASPEGGSTSKLTMANYIRLLQDPLFCLGASPPRYKSILSFRPRPLFLLALQNSQWLRTTSYFTMLFISHNGTVPLLLSACLLQ